MYEMVVSKLIAIENNALEKSDWPRLGIESTYFRKLWLCELQKKNTNKIG